MPNFTNSIYGKLDKFNAINSIHLLLSDPKHRNKAVVLLEGQDDISIFCTLLDLEDIFMFESYSGKNGVKEILEEFSSNQNVIGILDRDYEVAETSSKLFYCDHCNAEMMMISDDDFYSFTLYKALNIKSDFIEQRAHILNKLIELAAIRKLNELNSWGLSFNKLSVSECTRNTMGSTLDTLIYFLNRKNQLNPINLNDHRGDIIKREIDKLKNLNLYDYVNGHDFMQLLCYEMKASFSSNNRISRMNYSEFATYFRLGYSLDYFKKTLLYGKLKEYGLNNALKIVL
jgi:hypothetical protein